MKTNKKRFIPMIMLLLLAVAFVFALPSSALNAYASSDSRIDEILNYRETTDNDFADDRVLVVLSKQETMHFRSYSASDFTEIGISSVDELSKTSREVMQRQMNSSAREKNEMEINPNTFRTILCLKLQRPGKENVLEAVRKLKLRNDVISAEPDVVLRIESTNPNDTYYQANRQWGLNGANGINMPDAWEISSGVSTTVRVGIIDSGIDAGHPELNVNPGLSRDFTLAAPHTITTVTDKHGHGTHVAGIIGAIGNNGTGITGVCQGVELVSLRIDPTDDGSSFSSELVMAINYASTTNIRILNNSNGTDFFTGNQNDINAFTTAVTNYPGLFVTSAGNGARNNDENANRFPSNVRLPNMISVGAIDNTGNRSNLSNWGQTTVDIFAPGTDIFSTWKRGTGNFSADQDYQTESGTSMATPHVSGVAALLLSYNENLTTAELRDAILDNVTYDPGLAPLCVTGGRLNASAAIRSIKYLTTPIGNNEIRIDLAVSDPTGSIAIPEFLNGGIVTAIGTSAFANQTNLSEITIPSTITSIGNNAFSGCTDLSTVNYNATSVSNLAVNSNVFQNSGHSTSGFVVNIGDNVTNIPAYLFANSRVKTINNIGTSSYSTIGASAFLNCNLMSIYNIPSTITSIGNNAFSGCTNLETVNYNATSVSNLTVSSNVFQNSGHSTNGFTLNIGANVTKIPAYLFANSRVKTINNIGTSSYSTIGASAFLNCNLMVRYDIPSSVTTIGSGAFSNTNNASLYLQNKSTAPTTFDANWNASNNPVYLNGNICNHPTTTPSSVNPNYHANLCNTCRTATNQVSHSFTNSHVWKNKSQHNSYCGCGEGKLHGHAVAGGNGMGQSLCIVCGGPAETGFAQFSSQPPGGKSIASTIYIVEYIGNGSYMLSNGVIVLSEIDLMKFYNGTLTILEEQYHVHEDDYCCGHDDDQLTLFIEDKNKSTFIVTERREYIFD